MSNSTKDRIIDAVLDEVTAEGLSNLTLKAVADRAGIAIGLLSYHYKSRSELLRAAGERWHTKLEEAERTCWGAFLKASTPREGLASALVMAMNLGRENQAELRMMLRHVVVEGSIPEEIAAISMPLARATGDEAAKRLGITPLRARAVFHQTAILITRLSLLSDEELVTLYGDGAEVSPSEAWVACCAETAETLVRALGVDAGGGPARGRKTA